MADDAELLRRYIETQSEPAFTEFVGRHVNLVYFTALRTTSGDAALAQDVTQAVFAIAARRARQLIDHATPAGWLYTTARHIALRAWRKEQTRQRRESAAAMHETMNTSPHHDWERLRPVIDDALDSVGATEREAILVRFFEGHSYADMAVAWRISPDAARMRVDRALDKLRTALQRRGISSVSAALAAALATQGALAAPAGIVATVTVGATTAVAAPGLLAAAFSFMSGTKIIVGSAAVAVVLATGTAVLEHRRANAAELRAASISHDLAAARADLARAEQRRSVAESAAADADRDAGALLAAVNATRAAPTVTGGPAGAGPISTPKPDDPLSQTLQALFPNGIVATLGDRTITVEDVRREMTPLVPKLQRNSGSPAEFRQRLYALQNSIVADLVARQLDIKEFHYQAPDEAPRHIASQTVDVALADRMKEQFNNDPATLAAYLDARGLTPAQYRQSVEDDLVYAYMRTQQRRLPPTKDPAARSSTR